MVNWQVTATTIYCDAVDEDVTLMVYKNGEAECIGYKKYREPGKETVKLLERRSKQLGRGLDCEGSECSRVIQYRDKLFAEEAERGCVESNSGETVRPDQRE